MNNNEEITPGLEGQWHQPKSRIRVITVRKTIKSILNKKGIIVHNGC